MNIYCADLYDAIFEAANYKCISFTAAEDDYQTVMTLKSSSEPEIIDFVHAAWQDVFVKADSFTVDCESVKLFKIDKWSDDVIEEILEEPGFTCELNDIKTWLTIRPV